MWVTRPGERMMATVTPVGLAMIVALIAVLVIFAAELLPAT